MIPEEIATRELANAEAEIAKWERRVARQRNHILTYPLLPLPLSAAFAALALLVRCELTMRELDRLNAIAAVAARPLKRGRAAQRPA